MKLWRRLTGRETEEERQARVRAKVERCAASSDPRRSLGKLERIGRASSDLVGFGGVLHDVFRAAVTDAWRRSEPDRIRRSLPTVSSRPWGSWPVARISDLAAWAHDEKVDVLALLEEDGRAGGDAMIQLDALRRLAGDDRLAMVVVDGAELFVRRRFVLQAGSAARGELSDVVRELADGAEVLGYRVRSL